MFRAHRGSFDQGQQVSLNALARDIGAMAVRARADLVDFIQEDDTVLLDGVDGRLARKYGASSRFGARFDMEVDAVLICVLALLAWRNHCKAVLAFDSVSIVVNDFEEIINSVFLGSRV